MLKQASVSQIRQRELERGTDYLVATMRTYPRGLKKELLDEYQSSLSPAAELFKDFKKLQKEKSHDLAFAECDYENRFKISQLAYVHLKRLVEISRNQDVYLVCQCEVGQVCHRELLLLIAQKDYGAEIDLPRNQYPIFEKRIADRSFLTSQSFWG